MARGAPLPTIPISAGQDNRDLIRKLNDLIRTIELRLQAIEGTPNETSYDATNVTASRSFDADTVILADLADVVGTLIQDLQKGGELR